MLQRWILFLFMLFPALGFSQADTLARVLRFPAIYKNQIVFTYAGDLYSVPAHGGVARKLTSDVGYEMFPRFSPDGRWIAFTGQYDGNTEVYLMPAGGGVPVRLTYTATLSRDFVWDRMGPNNIVMGWTPDGRNIIFRSRMKDWNSFNGQLYLVSREGGFPQQLPLVRGGFCSYSPDGKKLAYNRVFREFRTWKRYRGGQADDVWIFDFETKTLENITNNPAQDIIPMWHGQRIYFLSDRDENQRMNLFVYDLASKETRQLTHFTEFDIKFPSIGPEAIVFENGGYIYRFDLADEQAARVPIVIRDDMNGGRGGLISVTDFITNYEIAPDGKRALFGARGDVFTVPVKHGNTRNLTHSPGVHERNSKWSPDGRWIAFISDASGENEIWIVPQDGKGQPRQLTRGADTYKFELRWSPDSKKILWSDKKLRLQYVEVATGQVHTVAKATAWEIRDYSWSPDSRWIAYARPEEKTMSKIYLYSLETGKTIEVTNGWYQSSQPHFSRDGKYLFFVSNRDFNPIYSWTEWNHAYVDMSRIYLVTLASDVPSPFAPKSDEVGLAGEPASGKKNKKTGKKGKETGTSKPVVVRVDEAGLKDRIATLPIKASGYSSLTSVGNSLYYLRRGTLEKKATLLMYNFDDEKETELGHIDGFEVSADGKKMLVKQGKKFAIIDLPKSPLKIEHTLNLSNMKVMLDRHAEWQDIFVDSWRQMRDFFYAPNMHGVDWNAVRRKYEPLVKKVNHRADLTYILGEMIGELNVGHTYVGGGDMPKPKRIQTGFLGADLERDAGSGYFRIKKILRGQNWDHTLRSPLTEIGVRAHDGDYIISVDGIPTNQLKDIHQALVDKAGKQVTLALNTRPSPAGSWTTVVVPIPNEQELRYFNWVQTNIEKVNKATNGQVGYIHIPDMGRHGLNEFAKYFYPQLRKKALIIDVRGNGGGNVSPMIIDRLRREAVMVEMARNTSPSPNPSEAVLGPMVCLIDEFSASDGDIFPYRFKKMKLGKLIGKRTWGGVVGIRGTLPLLDGGYLYKPEFAPYDLSGERWVIEGKGVEPDIYVDNDPYKEYLGIDQQLNKAIEVILQELKEKTPEIPPIPPYPKK